MTATAVVAESQAVTDRRARAALLIVVPEGERTYRVSGGAREHLVFVDGQGMLCDCRDREFSGLGVCKHTLAVLDFQKRQVTPMIAAEAALAAGGTELAALTAETAALGAARGRIDPVTWQAWREDLQAWLHDVMDGLDGKIRAQLMRGMTAARPQEPTAPARPVATPAPTAGPAGPAPAPIGAKYREVLTRLAREKAARVHG